MKTIMFSRAWAMPSADTFSIPPIRGFVDRYLAMAGSSVDPFARNSRLATFTNDLSLDTVATHHMDAVDFLHKMKADGVIADLGIFDPPYSPRQISECYKGVGRHVGMADTQSGNLYRRARDAMDAIIPHDGRVLSFGWNSVGMGKKRGYVIEEILLVSHGGAHNDTICMAERKTDPDQHSMFSESGSHLEGEK